MDCAGALRAITKRVKMGQPSNQKFADAERHVAHCNCPTCCESKVLLSQYNGVGHPTVEQA